MKQHSTPGRYAIGPHLIDLKEGQVVAYPDIYTRTAWAGQNWTETPFMTGTQVTLDGRVWESLIDFNVWKPGVSGWREIVAEGYPAWVQPTGAHDAYPLGARVSYNGTDYENTGSAANVWAPGVFGWTAP